LKVPVRLNDEYSAVKVALPYAHAEWSSITSPGLSIIGLSSLTSQQEVVQGEM